MVKKDMHENLKHTVKKHLAKKFKKYSHFKTITTSNIKQYWHFHRVTPKQYYTLFQTSNNTDIMTIAIIISIILVVSSY